MKSVLCSLCLLLAFMVEPMYSQTNGREDRFENIFRIEMPKKMDTLYYPFFGGVQMIEVDHIGYWDRMIFYLEQSQPRSMPYSAFNPMPLGNAYFFRDSLGNIVKAFNSGESLTDLTQHFKKIPLQKKSTGFRSLFLYHKFQHHRVGVWYQSPQALFDFPNHYKVSTGKAEQKVGFENSADLEKNQVKFGLIDTLGQVVIPLVYQAILPYYDLLLVQKEGKWGLINYKNEVVIDFRYDWYVFDRFERGEEPQKKSKVFFLTAKEKSDDKSEFVYKALYVPEENKLIPLQDYDKVQSEYSWRPAGKGSPRLTLVSKDGKTGLLGDDFQEIVPPDYEIFDYNRNEKGLFRVAKAGKFGFFDEHFQEIIATEYDYAEDFQSDSTALVLKDGTFFRINAKNQRQPSGITKPRWETRALAFIANEKYSSVSTRSFWGLIDTSTLKMVLPIVYHRQLSPERIQRYYEDNKARFEEKKLVLRKRIDMDDEQLFFQNKIIVQDQNNLFGVIDTTFQTLVDFKFEKLEPISSALNWLWYTKNGKQGAMDIRGKELLEGRFDEVRYDQHYEQERAVIKVKKDGKWGVVGFDNQTILPCMYDSIKFLGHWNRVKEKLWVVEKDKKFGVVDEHNQTFIPFDYQGISHLEGYNLWVESKESGRYKVVINK